MGPDLGHKEIPRHVTGIVTDRLSTSPVVIVDGPRTAGKTTVLSQVASQLGTEIIDLDDPVQLNTLRTNPGTYLDSDITVIIDEFQHFEELTQFIKADLNKRPGFGRFLLAGSTRFGTQPSAARPLTGRAQVVHLLPFSQGELDAKNETFVSRALTEPGKLIKRYTTLERKDLSTRVLTGGFPIAVLQPDGQARSRWFESHLEFVLDRDVQDIRQIRQRRALPALTKAAVANTGQLLNVSKLARLSDLDERTANDYIKLLESVFLVNRLPAWGTTLASRVRKLPKLHFVDSGLASHVAGINMENAIRPTPAVATELGHIIETFAVNEIIKQCSWFDSPLSITHFRQDENVEVDCVIEKGNGDIVGIEVKAGTHVTAQDFRGLNALQRIAGKKFLGGILLSTGSGASSPEPHMYSLPISALWHAP